MFWECSWFAAREREKEASTSPHTEGLTYFSHPKRERERERERERVTM